MYSVCTYIAKSCGLLSFECLSMSVMGLKKSLGGWWGEL